jgi:hypothetical protein
MLTNAYIQEFKVRSLTEDTFQLKIHRSDPDLELSPLEFYLDYQQLIQLIDECRRALK